MRLPSRVTPLLMVASLGCGGGDLALPSSDVGPEELVMVQGDHQVGVAGARLPDSLLVRVVDTLGVGVPGRQVTWVVAIGDGSVVPKVDTSDSAGLASTRWTLGPETGANAVRAMLPTQGFVTFTAVADSGDGGTTVPSSGRSTVSADPGTIVMGSESSTITVTVRDEQGNPVEGATVTLQASGAGNGLTQPSGTSSSDGTARGTLTGTEPGTVAVVATVNGSVQVSQTAEVTVTGAPAGHVDHFVFRLQPHDVHTGEPFRVEAALVDADGNVVPLSGVLMYLGLFPDGSDVPTNKRLSGDRFRATEDGVAVFDDLAVTKKGRYRLRVLSDQLPELGPHGPEPFLFSLPFEVN